MKKISATKNLEWFIMGLDLWVWPPDPEVGDWEAFRKWEPKNMGVIACLKLRWKIGFWGYELRSDKIDITKY